MNKYRVMILSVVCLGFGLTGSAIAKNMQTPVKVNQSSGLIEKCPECADLVNQINAKIKQQKAIDENIKTLKEAEKAKKEAEKAKKNVENKEKWEEPREKFAKKSDWLRSFDTEREYNPSNKTVKAEDKSLELLKQNNPELYHLTMEKERVKQDQKKLRERLADCRKVCASKSKIK